MEDDTESVDLVPKIQELHIIQIFGFDGKIVQSSIVTLNKKICRSR